MSEATSINFPEYGNLIIQGSTGPMVTISMKDGAVTFHDGYSLDEAAKTFWIGVGFRMPK